MLRRRRPRTLSNEGKKLYNIAHMPRHKLKDIIYNLFWSDYDKRLEEVVVTLRNATITLLKKNYNNEDITKQLDNGICNALWSILASDKKKPTMKEVKQNHRFYSDVMKKAYESNDHQTAMLYYLALTHGYITRLNVKQSKRRTAFLDKLKKEYNAKNNYETHVQNIINHGFANDYLPSLVATNEFKKTKKTSKTKYTNDNTEKELQDVLDIYGIIFYMFMEHCIPLYETTEHTMMDNFKISSYLKY